ncbi:MAG: glycosyltransferase [Caldilineaceae bacterium]|nr:glycosyltransferase [Caldilineaceae bacterium]
MNFVKHSRYQHNTDISYPQHFIALSERESIEIVFNESRLSTWIADAATRLRLTRFGSQKYPIISKVLFFLARHSFLFPWQLRDIDAIISFWFFPIPLSRKRIPIFFPTGFLPNEYVGARSDAERTEELVQLSKWFSRADLISFPAQSWINHFNSLNSNFRDKIIFLPFLLPGATPAAASFVHTKFDNAGTVSILFVGQDGKRKGLNRLCQALDLLAVTSPDIAAKLRVTIVSRTPFDRVQGVEIRHLQSLSRHEVLSLMREAHIFCLPTQRDSYGFVFIEAMANGCAIIADNQDPRPEILAQGECGILTDTSPVAIAAAIKSLVSDMQAAKALALRALRRYCTVYDFRQVRQQYIDRLIAMVGVS